MNGDSRSRFGDAGRRLALFPARAAARASRDQLEAAADEHLIPELGRLADRAFASDLPEEVARSLAEHRVLERVAAELAAQGTLDAAVAEALASRWTKDTLDRVAHSPEVRQAIRDVVSSQEIRDALAEQSVGAVQELAGDLRRRGIELDDGIERRARRRSVAHRSSYAGLATRGVAFLVDALAIAAIYLVVAGVLALISYLVGGFRPGWLAEALLGAGAIVVTGTYLLLFWSGAGRTPGMQLMNVRVRDRAGNAPSVGRAIVRVLVTWISIVPFFLGYATVLFDGRRRGLPDLIAGTEVVYDER